MDHNDIKIEELPEIYQALAEIVGIENMLKIAEVFANGEMIYFPKIDAILRPVRDRKIVEEFNGYNYEELAKKYRLSQMHIRAILKNNGCVSKYIPDENQITFF